MKLTLTPQKPRNPLATLARQRRAGSHQPSGKAQRQQQRRSLQRDVQREMHFAAPDRHSP
ncbi:MAG TPA: hypothetical protein VLA61_16980 [Ideonella sp.]|uniref:hypothetical protein n=1 Tax=Ideonella sp. TaxID=1929293 RepID=UPI002C9F9CD9|nr:hypothetical protein [Ideonella sp.]HSI49969.1 hypothetical protein [Ideonella sp.]